MISLEKNRIQDLRSTLKGKRIAVLGDMMLDSYIQGDVLRISPEAPVPIVNVSEQFHRLGGAANVALNLHALGAVPVPIGVLGNDEKSDLFIRLIENESISSEGLVKDVSRPTTSKTRVIAHGQHIVRIDHESIHPVHSETEERLISFFCENIGSLDAVILEDYNKGVLTPSLISRVIALAKEKKIIITVDPKRDNFFEYKNVTVMKPNRKEASDALGMKISSTEDLRKAGGLLLERLQAKVVFLTLGEDGVALFEQNGDMSLMPTQAHVVADVSGAGDTVISVLTTALCSGASIHEAAFLANYAGGIVCESVGVVPISTDVLFDRIEKDDVWA